MGCNIGSHYRRQTSMRERAVGRKGRNQSRTAKILAQAQLAGAIFLNTVTRGDLEKEACR
jgi:hypothetical protein